MSPSVAYWTSAMCPEMEAIASEVALLRRHFRRSVAWGVSPARWMQLSWRRGFGVHPRMHLAFRAATWALQRAFRINHIFGSLGDWFHLRAAQRRPTVLTVATEGVLADRQLLDGIDRYAVEWPAARDELARLGVERERVELIFPPVDLGRFSYRTSVPDQPSVLFASSPERADWLEARGVPMLLDAAQRLPHVRFRLLWRPWGTAFDVVQRRIDELGLKNVDLHRERVTDMATEYHRVNLTVAPFMEMSRCKAMPNSLLESLACGIPIVCTEVVGMAEVVRERGCGHVAAGSLEGLCEGIQTVLANQHEMGLAARRTAERWFSAENFIARYQGFYTQVL